ncbi:MAG: putative sulfate exporter family transporter, partial [Bryobacterales bacterium]|nr:putative sulfate exporter family transporter [Bryobacterales bacterium]
LSVLAQWLAGNGEASYWGIEYVIFSLLLGLLISNTVGTPAWLMPAVRTEYFIKTGLVMMGATILFGEIMQAGALGVVQSVAVVVVVWYVAFWICRRFRVDDEFAVMLASAVSICGVSAAIATCGAIQGDKKKLSYVTSVVLIVAAPMIIIQPWLAKALAMPDAVAGAWMGGTLDTTGSVVAAAALISETAMKVGTIVKFSQNVLIGFAAFGLSVWWTLRNKNEGQRPTVGVIWERFPKFVLGFMVASLVFSFLLGEGIIGDTKKVVSGLRTMWFSLAFVCIGLETNFREFLRMEEGRPFFAFLAAQGFNLLWTFLLAWLVFGGLIWPSPF